MELGATACLAFSYQKTEWERQKEEAGKDYWI